MTVEKRVAVARRLTRLTHGAAEGKHRACAERSPSVSPFNVATTARCSCYRQTEEAAPTFSTADSSRQQAACRTAAAESTVKVTPGTQLATSDRRKPP